MMNMHSRKVSKNHAGFTIVELMIATLVFSVILILITSGVLQFTKSYTKGVNSSSTQQAARSVMDSISQAVQLNGTIPTITPVSGGVGAVCVGDQQFTYYLGNEFNGHIAPGKDNHALYQTKVSSGDCNDPNSPDPATRDAAWKSGHELLSKNMRLSHFLVVCPDGELTCSVDIRIAYGDADLLCSPSAATGTPLACDGNGPTDSDLLTKDIADLSCRGGAGSEFCAGASLSTTVLERVVQ